MGYQTPTGAGAGASVVNVYPPGTIVNSDSLQLKYTSTGTVSAPRVLYAAVGGPALADKDTVSHQDKLLGVTITSAAGSGEEVTVVTEGKIDDPSFSFTPGPIWLGNSGLLTQTKPTTGLLVQIAVAITATLINVNIQMAIKLA